MPSLEKKMFFLPYKLFVRQSRLYIAFNLSVIPRDMEITSMYLHVQLPKHHTPTTVYLKRLLTYWDEASLRNGIVPSRSQKARLLRYTPEQTELIINVTNYRNLWRKRKKNNHGIYLWAKGKNFKYIESNPPYLVLETI
ncbi:hypothetical protein BHU72_13030 [Desulfuribacillus stibiiarsenatis]|uniref:Uncharacterized protein n=1 Tax=Desulfuribacillus stibiiarsenatis TaxID=1390249 RepID=A0A1E5L961_9FIRM|nr:hypothetical protein [Desulfuribacillus stibiiarsenatis]OEH86529.1 hypothetical protein BHU72_13030 [Desulfuribacillus stibiiarsenatis]